MSKILVPHIYDTLEDCLTNLATARAEANNSEHYTDEHICTEISLEGMVYTGQEEDMVFISDGIKHGWCKTFGFYTFDKPKR
jgi:hypothetical protein